MARRVSAAGRSAAFIAGRAASAADLRTLGSRLLAFYGQHEHRKLTLSAAQAEILDGFAGDEHLALRARYREAHAEVIARLRERAELKEREGTRERDIDLLRFELGEIEEVAPEADENESLEGDRDRLRHAESLREGAGVATLALGGGEEGGGAVAAIARRTAALDESELRYQLAALGSARWRSGQASELGMTCAPTQTGSRRSRRSRRSRCAWRDRRCAKHAGEAGRDSTRRARAATRDASAASSGATRLRRVESRRRAPKRAPRSSRVRAEGGAAAPTRCGELASARGGSPLESRSSLIRRFGPRAPRDRARWRRPGMPSPPGAPVGASSAVILALRAGPAGRSNVSLREIDAGVGGGSPGAEASAATAGRGPAGDLHHPLAQVPRWRNHVRREEAGGAASVARVEAVSGDEQLAEIVRMLGAERGDEAAAGHARELLAA